VEVSSTLAIDRVFCYGESARKLGRVSQLVLLRGSLVQLEHVLLSIASASSKQPSNGAMISCFQRACLSPSH
jgi:hypothetical protein